MSRLSVLVFLVWLSFPSLGTAASLQAPPIRVLDHTSTIVMLTWDAASPADHVINYVLSFGPTAGGPYTHIISVGNTVLAAVSPPIGINYFVVQAQNADGLSPYSNEVSVVIPVTDPRCVFPLGDMAISIFPTKLTLTGSGSGGSKARLDFQLASPNSPIEHVAIRHVTDWAVMDGAELGALAGMWFTIPTTPGTYVPSIFATNKFGCSFEIFTGFTVTAK